MIEIVSVPDVQPVLQKHIAANNRLCLDDTIFSNGEIPQDSMYG